MADIEWPHIGNPVHRASIEQRDEDIFELEEVLWQQYPIDQYVRVDGELLKRIINYLQLL